MANLQIKDGAGAAKYIKSTGAGTDGDPHINHNWIPIDSYHDIQQAINVISSTYGDTVSVDTKQKTLNKFGTNPSVGSSGRYTIWYTGQDQANETYVAANTNSIDSISSNNAGDTTQTVTIEGHTESGGNKTFVVQTANLNGQTRVALTTALNRVTRCYNSSATVTAGALYIYENTALTAGKPTDTTKIHLTVPTGEQQSQKASTSISSSDYWIVTSFHAGYNTKTGTNTADVRMEVRQSGGVFRPVSPSIMIVSGTEGTYEFGPYLVVPKNADVRLTANASASGQEILGGIQGYLAVVV